MKIKFTIDMAEASGALVSSLQKRISDLEHQLRSECAIAVEFAKLLMEDLTAEQIEAKLERFELICEQRGISLDRSEQGDASHTRFRTIRTARLRPPGI